MNDIVAIMRAADFAARKHMKQKRKGEEAEPYLNHLIEVASLASFVARHPGAAEPGRHGHEAEKSHSHLRVYGSIQTLISPNLPGTAGAATIELHPHMTSRLAPHVVGVRTRSPRHLEMSGICAFRPKIGAEANRSFGQFRHAYGRAITRLPGDGMH